MSKVTVWLQPKCPPKTWNAYVPRDDVRIEMCGVPPSMSSFTTIHHEMGHVHNYLLYSNQTHIYYEGKYFQNIPTTSYN